MQNLPVADIQHERYNRPGYRVNFREMKCSVINRDNRETFTKRLVLRQNED